MHSEPNNLTESKKQKEEKLEKFIKEEDHINFFRVREQDGDIELIEVDVYSLRLDPPTSEATLILKKILKKHSGPFWKIDYVSMSTGRCSQGNSYEYVLVLNMWGMMSEDQLKEGLKQLSKAFKVAKKVFEAYNKIKEDEFGRFAELIIRQAGLK